MRKEYARLRRRPFLMPLWLPVAGALLALVLAAWAVMSASTTVVLVVRHAEAQADGGTDPLLSTDGEARAQRLAALLASAPGWAPDVIVVSGLRRTQETARPLAAALGVPVVVMDRESPGRLADRVLGDYRGQRVLVVGHSNTVPGIVGSLVRGDVPAMGETEHGTLYVVAVPRFSRPAAVRLELP